MEIRLKDGWSKYQIAKSLGCSYNTIKNEYEREKDYFTMAKLSVTKLLLVSKLILNIVKKAQKLLLP